MGMLFWWRIRREVAKALLTRAKWWKRKERGVERAEVERALVMKEMQIGAEGGRRGELMVRNFEILKPRWSRASGRKTSLMMAL